MEPQSLHNNKFDVIVIGAGVMGSATAYATASNSSPTTTTTLLLEQFDFLHHRGSSHGESRTIRATYPEHYYSSMVFEASKLWDAIQSEFGSKVWYKSTQLDVGPRDSKSLCSVIANCNKTPMFYGMSSEFSKSYNENEMVEGCDDKNRIGYRVLDCDEVREKYNGVVEILEGWVGVMTDIGGVVKPTKAVSMFQTLARKHGAVLRDNCEVVDVRRDGGGVAVEVKGGEVFWGWKCVITAGAWMRKLIERVRVGVDLPVQPVETMVYYWRIREGCEEEFTIGKGFPSFASYGEPYIYGTPALEFPNLIKVAVHGGWPCDPDSRTWGSSATAVEALREWIRGRFGDKVDTSGPVMSQSCLYSMTPDEDYVIDFLGGEFGEDVVIGGGFSGHGFKMAPIVGRMLADMALKGKVEGVEMKHFSLGRFEGNPKGNVKEFEDQVCLNEVSK